MTEEVHSALTARLLDGEEEESYIHEETERNAKNESTTVEADLVESQPESITTEQSWERGEQQPSAFRDWPFGAIFHLQFIAVIALGSFYTNSFIQTQGQFGNGGSTTNSDQDLNLMTIIRPTLISAVTAVLLVLVAFSVMTRLGKSFISCSVWTSAVLSFVVGITALTAGLVGFGIFSLFSALIGCCYAFSVRNRIPFAAANLSAAISSIKANGGVILLVILLGALMFGWIILWTISLFGVIDVQVLCDENDVDNNCSVEVQQGGWILPWIFFLFWTQQVFKNLIHTTVAGLVGTWYFSFDEANSFCSSALRMSLFRSLTYSFGSICYGSLLVAVLQTLDWIVQSLRSERDRNGNVGVSLLLCCLDCILSLLQGIIKYFNNWVSLICANICCANICCANICVGFMFMNIAVFTKLFLLQTTTIINDVLNQAFVYVGKLSLRIQRF